MWQEGVTSSPVCYILKAPRSWSYWKMSSGSNSVLTWLNGEQFNLGFLRTQPSEPWTWIYEWNYSFWSYQMHIAEIMLLLMSATVFRNPDCATAKTLQPALISRSTEQLFGIALWLQCHTTYITWERDVALQREGNNPKVLALDHSLTISRCSHYGNCYCKTWNHVRLIFLTSKKERCSFNMMFCGESSHSQPFIYLFI